jgi:hypothetical protein
MYWVVSWVKPKIIGAFDFRGSLWRWINMTNDTIASVGEHTKLSLADVMLSVESSYFPAFELMHLWSSSDMYDAETGEVLNSEREHMFSVEYEVLIWDRNTLPQNEDVLNAILRPDTEALYLFAELMLSRANITILELFPTNIPISFNETVIAPDSQADGAQPCRDTRLISLWAVMNLLACLSDHHR